MLYKPLLTSLTACVQGMVADMEGLQELQPEAMREQEKTACDELQAIREGGGPCSCLVDGCCGRPVRESCQD